jgi:hypothetical protein
MRIWNLHIYGQLDPDTYQHQCEKLEPDPYQCKKPGGVEATNGAMKVHPGALQAVLRPAGPGC